MGLEDYLDPYGDQNRARPRSRAAGSDTTYTTDTPTRARRGTPYRDTVDVGGSGGSDWRLPRPSAPQPGPTGGGNAGPGDDYLGWLRGLMGNYGGGYFTDIPIDYIMGLRPQLRDAGFDFQIGSDNTWRGWIDRLDDRGMFRQGNERIGPTQIGLRDPYAEGRMGEFDDFWGSGFERAVQERLRALGVDPSRFSMDEYVKRLLDADKAKQENTDKFVAATRERIGDLKKPAYTDSEEAAIRARSFDQLERRRQETLKNEKEQVYMRGFAPTSGLAQGAANEVNRNFEQARTGIESELLHSAIDENQRRADQALALEQLVEQALSGADLASLEMLAKTAQIEDSLIQDRESRARETLQTYMLPLDLMERRMASARANMGMGGGANDSLSTLMNLLQLGQNGRNARQASNANNNAGLGQILEILFPRG